MKLLGLAFGVFTALAASQALAFSEDDKSMNSPQTAQRFSDPDEATPGGAVYMQGGKAASGDTEDPSSIRYDYDPASASYVPHRQ